LHGLHNHRFWVAGAERLNWLHEALGGAVERCSGKEGAVHFPVSSLCSSDGPFSLDRDPAQRRSGHVAPGAQSAFVLNTPAGTAFSRLRWSGHAQRRDCHYALQLYAVRPDGSDATVKNVRANSNCPSFQAAQASSWPRPRAYDLGGATRIVQRVVCVGAASAQFCSGRGLNYMQTFTAEAAVVDNSGPSVTIVPDSPLARGEWVSGTQAMDYEASDNVGVRSAFANLAGLRSDDDTRASSR